MALTLKDELRCGIGFLRQEIIEDTRKREAMINLLQRALKRIEEMEQKPFDKEDRTIYNGHISSEQRADFAK